MKLKNKELARELFVANETLLKLDVKGRIRLAYNCSKNKKIITDALVPYFDTRAKLIRDYAIHDEKGRPVLDEARVGLTFESPQHESDYRRLHDELDEMELELDLKMIELDMLDGVNGITGELVHAMRFIIKE